MNWELSVKKIMLLWFFSGCPGDFTVFIVPAHKDTITP
jgi:hypothetical protein